MLSNSVQMRCVNIALNVVGAVGQVRTDGRDAGHKDDVHFGAAASWGLIHKVLLGYAIQLQPSLALALQSPFTDHRVAYVFFFSPTARTRVSAVTDAA